MKPKEVLEKAVDRNKQKPIKKPFYTENETIHKDGHTQVRLWLTREQAQGLDVFHRAVGVPYHVLVQIAVSEYVDNHLNADEKAQVKRILRPPQHIHTIISKI